MATPAAGSRTHAGIASLPATTIRFPPRFGDVLRAALRCRVGCRVARQDVSENHDAILRPFLERCGKPAAHARRPRLAAVRKATARIRPVIALEKVQQIPRFPAREDCPPTSTRILSSITWTSTLAALFSSVRSSLTGTTRNASVCLPSCGCLPAQLDAAVEDLARHVQCLAVDDRIVFEQLDLHFSCSQS